LDTGGDEFARRRVRPLVVAADDVAHRAGQIIEQPRPPVAADVVVRPDLTVVIADDDDGIGADVDREIVAGFGHFGSLRRRRSRSRRRSPRYRARRTPG
jgi:hypothetical protein